MRDLFRKTFFLFFFWPSASLRQLLFTVYVYFHRVWLLAKAVEGIKMRFDSVVGVKDWNDENIYIF